MRAEKKRTRLLQTPRNLSIHKDMSEDRDEDDGDVYQMKDVQACPVVNSDQGEEVLIGELAFTVHICRVPTVRESQGILRESGKTERVREKSGNFKILLTRPIIYALFSQFLSASPPDPHRGSVSNTAG